MFLVKVLYVILILSCIAVFDLLLDSVTEKSRGKAVFYGIVFVLIISILLP